MYRLGQAERGPSLYHQVIPNCAGVANSNVPHSFSTIFGHDLGAAALIYKWAGMM